MAKIKRILEIRAEGVNPKALEEQRADLVIEMDTILDKAKEEKRAMSTEEDIRFNEIKNQISAIDNTLKAEEERAKLENKQPGKKNTEEEKRAQEEANFVAFLRGEQRALDVANNGSVIPTHIANKIIETVKELSPIYSMATIYNVGGDLAFPVYDETTPIQAAYVDDMVELTEQTGKFTVVKLQNYIVGCLAKISKSLMNRTDFDLVGFVVKKVAKAIADFLEKELINGTTNKMTGILSATSAVTTASGTAITADELIDVQMAVPEIYQGNACWIMHKNTLKSLRKLKNSDGDYLLTKDLTSGFGWLLLGKRVYITESMPAIALGKKAIAYGDMSGLYVKLAQNVELQMLMEKYATQHAIGVCGYVECDSKIIEPQKIVTLTMKAS